MIELLNKVVENVTQAIDKVQETFTSHLKSLEERMVSNQTTEDTIITWILLM